MLIIVDSNALAHRVKHTLKDLSYAEKKTGVIFGFLNSVLKMSITFQCRHFAFCWDSGKSYRRQMFPPYKASRQASREKTEEDKVLDRLAYRQFHELRMTVLPRLGFTNNFIQTGYEGDDLVASLVKSYSGGEYGDIIVAARDNDLYQLLEDCQLYEFQGKGTYTAQLFEKEYKIPPRRWAEVKCLSGCSTDEVPGVPGVGEIKAIQYLLGTLNGKIKFRIESEEGQAIIKRNEPLVVLPMPGTKTFQLNFDKPLHSSDFQVLFEDYGFNSFLRPDRFNKWCRQFEMEDE